MKILSLYLCIPFALFCMTQAYSYPVDPVQDSKTEDVDSEGRALESAIYAGNDAWVEKLIKEGAQDPEGYALEAAIEREKYSLVDRLIADQKIQFYKVRCPNKSALCPKVGLRNPKPPISRDYQGRVLLSVVEKGKYDIAEKMLENLMTKDPQGYALEAAIAKEQYGLAENILKLGEAQDPEGRALAAAQEKGNVALVKKLLALKAKDAKGEL